jgi:micrococcal nuclease
MPTSKRCLALAGFLALSPAFAGAAEAMPEHHMISAQVIRVVDGDTLEVLVGKRKVRVHVNGIDAPEANQPWGKEATLALSQLVLGQSVDLEPVGGGSGSRITAIVFVGEAEVGATLVSGGNAWADRRDLRPSDVGLCEVEASAREEKLGLWALPPPKRVAPWLFRVHFLRPAQPQRGAESVEECKAAALRKRSTRRAPAPATAPVAPVPAPVPAAPAPAVPAVPATPAAQEG